MKSGTCPKCKSETVCQRSFPGGYRSSLVLAFDTGVRLKDYISGSCGYVESYLEDLSKINKIEKRCCRVTSQPVVSN